MSWYDHVLLSIFKRRTSGGRGAELVDKIGGEVLVWERVEHARLEQGVARKRFWESIEEEKITWKT
ncbi:MAG: hypothetical protein ACLQU1_36330 [Bryobacteraceae bacterium]